MLTFTRAAPFTTRVFYPISRPALAGVVFRAGLVEGACVFLTVGLLFSVMGLGAGWGAGYGTRLDFVPHFLRALLGTMILLPVVQGVRLRVQNRRAGRSPETVVLLIMGVTGLVTAVSVWSFVSPALLPGAGLEIVVSLVLLSLSQVLYRRWLGRYYLRGDLT
jgi:hypothetical protein